MTKGPAIPCLRCKRSFGAIDWIDANRCTCRYCQEDFDFFPFPALTRSRAVAIPQATAVAEDSTCFFHAENQAEKLCESCGRFLCTVCAVPFGGRTVCPSCISAKKNGADDTQVINGRTLYDGMALSLALFPMIIWFFTIFTAPITLGVVIYGWKKQGSLVRGRRWRMVVAGLIALAQIAGWTILGVTLALKK